MQTVNLYRYDDPDGVAITPNKRNLTDELFCFRLIADEGFILTDGTTETPCIDTHEPYLWEEIPYEETNIPAPPGEMEELNNE